MEMRMAKRKQKRSKMRNVKATYKGINFDSLSEIGRYVQLEMLEKAGQVRNIETQVRYDCYAWVDGEVCGKKVCFYKADFRYEMRRMLDKEWTTVVEDVKGRRSGPAWTHFRLKAKLIKANYDLDIDIIDSKDVIDHCPSHLRSRKP
jgi:hypothetical protein